MASERTTGHTALVTGGTGGLGAAIARALHDAGHAVLVSHSPGNARVRAWLDAQAAEGYRFAAYSGDVADEASCRDSEVGGSHDEVFRHEVVLGLVGHRDRAAGEPLPALGGSLADDLEEADRPADDPLSGSAEVFKAQGAWQGHFRTPRSRRAG